MSDININYAVRPRKPGLSLDIEAVTLHTSPVRDVPLPEPVATGRLNGRPPGGFVTGWEFCWFPPVTGEWEEAAIRAARERERRAELALLAGTLGQPP